MSGAFKCRPVSVKRNLKMWLFLNVLVCYRVVILEILRDFFTIYFNT